MDLRQLEYFLAVVEHGGVPRAAAALHVAQPSLSQSLRRLERDLQTDLFHRVGRGLVLAPAGEALVGPARQMLRTVGSAYDAVREVRDLEAGRVDVASLADLSADPAAIWVAQFRVVTPRVSARIEERGGVSQVAELVGDPHPRPGEGPRALPAARSASRTGGAGRGAGDQGEHRRVLRRRRRHAHRTARGRRPAGRPHAGRQPGQGLSRTAT